MIELRPFSALRADRGWLKAKHHFSLGGENHSARAGWGAVSLTILAAIKLTPFPVR